MRKEKVTKKWLEWFYSLNSTLFALNVKKNLDLSFLKQKSLPPKNTEFHGYILFSVFSAKISGRNKNVYRFCFIGIETDVIIKRGKEEVVLKKNLEEFSSGLIEILLWRPSGGCSGCGNSSV